MGGEMFARYVPSGERRRLPESAVVRLASTDDLEMCARIAAARDGADTSVWISRFAAYLAADREALLVADIGEVVGYGRVAWIALPPDAPKNAAPTGYYLMGLVIDARWRRSGLGERLTAARLDWVWERAPECWYFASARNRPSLDLHAKRGFTEVTRDFWFPNVTFTGGEGVICRAVRPGDRGF
jgi:GNAT superfamily N-acetyltransferase